MHKSVEEFSVSTIEVAGFGAALSALHLPFGGKMKSYISGAVGHVSDFFVMKDENEWRLYSSGMYIEVNPKDINLLSTLVKRGDEHAKVLRGICVWVEINAPRYWWQECDRYSVGACCLASNSTMHQHGKGLNEDELVMMKERLIEGTMQKRVWMFSYQTLRRIYFQRRTHRLPQWRIFCEWIETLPFAKELITIDGRDNKD